MKKPVLDPLFYPMEQALSDYFRAVEKSGKKSRITLDVERPSGREVYSFDAFADGVDDERNYHVAERLAKMLLWTCGGYRLGVTGSPAVYERLSADYRAGGARAFDADFMGEVFERPFEVTLRERAPEAVRRSLKVGGHLDGCRVGFDAGGSDRKVSAVIDGVPVYSEEVVWNPKTESNPHYHYDGILSAIRTAASKMPRVDCIGVSSAGVYVENRAMVASLFLKVDKKRYGDFVKDIYLNVAKEIGAPVEVANDGDVTALAGSMELGEGRVLGIAMGTSEAVGYINAEGGLNGWFSELAFAPVDFACGAARDEWSGDFGVGCKYFSQDAVVKLAENGGMRFPEGLTPAQKLLAVQKLMEEGDPLAGQIYEDIGVYLGHALPFYARFYDIKHVLLLGRVMSGKGGERVLESCKRTLAEDYPAFSSLHIYTPDETNKRVGQSIAAASLPEIGEIK